MANIDYGFKVKEEEERERGLDSHLQEEKTNSSKAFNKLSFPTTGQITRVSTTLGVADSPPNIRGEDTAQMND